MEYGGFGILSFIYTRSRSRPTGSVDTSCRFGYRIPSKSTLGRLHHHCRSEKDADRPYDLAHREVFRSAFEESGPSGQGHDEDVTEQST
jgi:hypothetical protein